MSIPAYPTFELKTSVKEDKTSKSEDGPLVIEEW